LALTVASCYLQNKAELCGIPNQIQTLIALTLAFVALNFSKRSVHNGIGFAFKEYDNEKILILVLILELIT